MLFFFSSIINAQVRFFTKEDFTQDILFLKTRICSIHPLAFDAAFDSLCIHKKNELISSIGDSIGPFEYYYKALEFACLLNDGHTYVSNALPYRTGELSSSDPVLPITIQFIKNKAFIVKNYSNYTLPVNAEIEEINNFSIDSLLQKLSTIVIHENDLEERLNNSQKNIQQFDQFSNHLYYLGITSPFRLKIRTPDPEYIYLSGIKRSELKECIKKDNIKKEALELTEIDSTTARLNINTFRNALIFASKYTYSPRKMKSILKNVEGKYKNLVIDVRNNSGGNPNYSYNTVDYFTASDYQIRNFCFGASFFKNYSEKKLRTFYSKLYRLTDKTLIKEKVAKLFLQSKGEGSLLVDTAFSKIKRENHKKITFSGNVYVLMGAGSYSATILFIDMIKYLNIGLTIGGCSGGNSAVSGFSVRSVLPKSMIDFQIRSAYDMPLSTEKITRPIQPHLFKEPSIEDIINNKDIQLDFVKELIKKEITIKNYKKSFQNCNQDISIVTSE
jgi:hypothetical protein